MAKSGHTFAKRKREQEKKAKAAAKRAKRAAAKRQETSPGAPTYDGLFDRFSEDDTDREPGVDET